MSRRVHFLGNVIVEHEDDPGQIAEGREFFLLAVLKPDSNKPVKTPPNLNLLHRYGFDLLPSVYGNGPFETVRGLHEASLEIPVLEDHHRPIEPIHNDDQYNKRNTVGNTEYE